MLSMGYGNAAPHQMNHSVHFMHSTTPNYPLSVTKSDWWPHPKLCGQKLSTGFSIETICDLQTRTQRAMLRPLTGANAPQHGVGNMLVNIGKGIEMDVPPIESLTKEVRDHIVYLGWRNVLMDSHAGITEKDNPLDFKEKSKAIAEKKLAALAAGEVRTATVREGDPVRAEAIALIAKAIMAKAKADRKKITEADARKEARELLAKAKPDNKFMVQARKNVEASRALAADLDDLV